MVSPVAITFERVRLISSLSLTILAEGTADMMDWAAREHPSPYHIPPPTIHELIIVCSTSVHARARGAENWWKSFTTGKSAETLGGVPHDIYGMTSLSIRQYVLGIYKQLGLREKDITKVQTGGPGQSKFTLGLASYLCSSFMILTPVVFFLMQMVTLALVSDF